MLVGARRDCARRNAPHENGGGPPFEAEPNQTRSSRQCAGRFDARSLLLTLVARVGRDDGVARPLRIEYPGARYHLVSRGDRREPIFVDDRDRELFLRTLGETCAKTGWQVHAYCLMGNHFHVVVETPQPNLVTGMRWLLGTYTQRFNRRHRDWGHLFGGRYKAQLIDERALGYLAAACDYVHLNPQRAGLIEPGKTLESYPWSSYPAFLAPAQQPSWLRIDRVLGEHGLQGDSASRREFARRMNTTAVGGSEQYSALRRGWKLGAEDFADWLAGKLARRGRLGERARERRETDEALAERLVRSALADANWNAAELTRLPKGHVTKVRIARELRRHTPMTRRWIAQRLKMGSASYVSNLLGSVDREL